MTLGDSYIRQFYDDATYRKLHGFIYTNDRVEYAWQRLQSILNSHMPSSILEIGCGIGEAAYRVAEYLPLASVTGFDISERSIAIASKLFVLPNLSFTRGDKLAGIELAEDKKFDLVYLVDVYEHIPIDQRKDLFQFIHAHLAKGGSVLMSCPTPRHLQYLEENIPAEIQPVDEHIALKELAEFAYETALDMVYYKEISVWRAGDYFHVIFSNQHDLRPYSDLPQQKVALPVSVKTEIKNRVKKVISSKSKAETSNAIDQKKAMIRERLGVDVLQKAEAFKP